MTTPSFSPQPCCGDAAGASCMTPMQFCQSTTTTGPVDHPGRSYDIQFLINPGFTVNQVLVGATTYNAGITWDVSDPDGSAFAEELRAFIQPRIAGSTVTVTNPNAGSPQVCGVAQPMTVHIECLRLDEDPPTLIELLYDAGQDLVINPAYNESPPLNPPVAQGPYGFRLLSRQDDPGPFPGSQPANDTLCTSVANRGWETNDSSRTFEIWGKDVADAQNTMPTPRGTPVQEITSDSPPPGGLSTIWQTFVAPFSGDFIIRLVHGARDPGEVHRITLDNGDTGATQSGDLIDNITTPPTVTSAGGGPNPWTQFNQTIPLVGGSTYTLALSSTNPAVASRGGLFTDMRAFIERPDARATATTDDETCVVTVDETTTETSCTFWQPLCEGGEITEWRNVATGTVLTNELFWAQEPPPACCTGESAPSTGGGGGSSNLVATDVVCVTIGGIQQNAVRQVLFSPVGAEIGMAFIGTNGSRLTPDSWTVGDCVSQRYISDTLLCDQQADGTSVGFLRKYIQTWSAQFGAQVVETRDFTLTTPAAGYVVTGTVVNCGQSSSASQSVVLCDSGNGGRQFLRNYLHTGDEITGTEDTALDGSTPYVPTGPVVACSDGGDFTEVGLCLGDGTPIGVVARHTETGAVAQDGWINLLTGAYSVGMPPAGTKACGDGALIQTSDVLCDISPTTGEVNGLVLVQYNYNPDGSIGSTTLVDAVTGAPYGTPVGEITVCPTDTSVPGNDLQVLCDVQADGSQVPIVRDYRRDLTGTITGFSDYTVGGTPYAATGTVGTCIPRDVETMVMCDGTGTRFLRTYRYNTSGLIQGFSDSTLAGTPFAPSGAVNNCAGDGVQDTELVQLCDDNGVFVRRFLWDNAGTLTGTADFTLAGVPYAPVGPVSYRCTDPTPQAMVYEACEDIPREEFVVGAELLANGMFERSAGVGATSVPGPGWVSSYTPCGPSIFAAPCGAATWAFFTTNAGQVTGGNATANQVEALGARSMAVNVGPNVNLPIIEWQNVYLENGKTYRLSADAAILLAPYDVALKIGGSAAPGGLFPLSAPPVGNWGKTVTTFTYAQPSGYTSVGLYSNNAAAGGNDHAFDNFELHEVSQAQAGTLTPRIYSGTTRSVIDQVVSTAGCNDDRRDALLGELVDVSIVEPPAVLDATVQRQTGAGSVTIASGARSVTLTVLTGDVTITTLGQGNTVVPAGAVLTWAVDGAGEALNEAFTFTGVAGSSFIVHSTRQ